MWILLYLRAVTGLTRVPETIALSGALFEGICPFAFLDRGRRGILLVPRSSLKFVYCLPIKIQ